MLLFEIFNGRVTLRASLAISLQQFVRHAANFKTEIPATGIASLLNVVAEAAHFLRQGVPIDLR